MYFSDTSPSAYRTTVVLRLKKKFCAAAAHHSARLPGRGLVQPISPPRFAALCCAFAAALLRVCCGLAAGLLRVCRGSDVSVNMINIVWPRYRLWLPPRCLLLTAHCLPALLRLGIVRERARHARGGTPPHPPITLSPYHPFTLAALEKNCTDVSRHNSRTPGPGHLESIQVLRALRMICGSFAHDLRIVCGYFAGCCGSVAPCSAYEEDAHAHSPFTVHRSPFTVNRIDRTRARA